MRGDQGGRGIALGQRALGALGLLAGVLHVDLCVGRELERERVAPGDQARPERAADLGQHAAERGLGGGWGLRGPEDMGQLVAVDGSGAVEHEVGEQRPALASGQLRRDGKTGDLHRELAEQLDPQRRFERAGHRRELLDAGAHRLRQSVLVMVTR